MNIKTTGQPVVINNWRMLIKNPSWAILVGVTVTAVYLLLLPFVARSWRATGDEPHYLLAAHSLVYDADLDLSNNYAQMDYLNFYFSRDIAPQVRLNRAGRQILNHYPGLVFLIAPAYAAAGRFGVLFFQAVMGGLLASLTFKLAHFISGNTPAALLATGVAALVPPLLMYPYLVYPELVAALLTTLILYLAISRDQAGLGPMLTVFVALAMLPWLNRRFIPVALTLALLIAWSWRRRGSWQGLFTAAGTGAPAVVIGSVAGIIWFNSQLTAPLRADIAAAPSYADFWLRFFRGAGWLVDQQRGLFIFAPVYILTLWGLPALVRHSWRHRARHWTILLPFLVSMGVTSMAGGFWIAWELGPRFLIVALPGLVPLPALAWRDFNHNKIWLAGAILVTAVSLLNSWVIVRNPELPYKSSLPLFYGEKLSLPLADILPDMAGYARIEPEETTAPTTALAGETVWNIPAGKPVKIIKSATLSELPFGHYILNWPIWAGGVLPADAKIARLSIKHLGGGPVLNHTISAGDLPDAGRFGAVATRFANRNADRWRAPMVLNVTATGASNLQARFLLLKPDPFYAFVLPLLSLLGLAIAATVFYTWFTPPHNYPWPEIVSGPGKSGWIWLLLVGLAATGYLIFTQSRSSRTYDAGRLSHFVGRPVSDTAAVDGDAWSVDPALDPPQKAIYGPFDIFDAGQYRVTFRLKIPQNVETDREIATLQVNATANFDPLRARPVLAKHFSQPNLYHDMILAVANPRRQSLSFEVHYLGLAPLIIDGVTVERINK